MDVLFTDRLANALGNFNNPCPDLSTELKKKKLDSYKRVCLTSKQSLLRLMGCLCDVLRFFEASAVYTP